MTGCPGYWFVHPWTLGNVPNIHILISEISIYLRLLESTSWLHSRVIYVVLWQTYTHLQQIIKAANLNWLEMHQLWWLSGFFSVDVRTECSSVTHHTFLFIYCSISGYVWKSNKTSKRKKKDANSCVNHTPFLVFSNFIEEKKRFWPTNVFRREIRCLCDLKHPAWKYHSTGSELCTYGMNEKACSMMWLIFIIIFDAFIKIHDSHFLFLPVC